MKKEEFVPVFLDVLKVMLLKNLPNQADESVLRTCAWFEIEGLVRHIRFAENSAKAKDEMTKEKT